MTEIEEAQLAKLKARLGMGDDTDQSMESSLIGYLEDAKWIILTTRFPCGIPENQEVEPQYLNLQIRMAIELFSKEGAEGETAHSEGGINRTYESAGVSSSLIDSITPKVGIVNA